MKSLVSLNKLLLISLHDAIDKNSLTIWSVGANVSVFWHISNGFSTSSPDARVSSKQEYVAVYPILLCPWAGTPEIPPCFARE